jgi:DNA modification methylase
MPAKPKMPVEWVRLDDLLAAERNPKLHDIESVAASIREHGYVDHGVLDRRTGRMVGGHGRAGALRWLRERGELPEHWDTVQSNVWVDAKGDWWVPTSITTTRDADDADNLLIALNSGDRPGWDRGGLAAMLDHLRQTDIGLTGTGYDNGAVDDLLAQIAAEAPPVHVEDDPRADDVPTSAPAITRPGDMWKLGDHRVMCGDCRDPEQVARLLDGSVLNLGFTSPPYAAQRVYDESSGFTPIPADEYVDWFAPVSANVEHNLSSDGSWFVNIKEHASDGQRVLYVKDLTIAHVREWGWRLVDEFCWTRPAPPGAWPDRFKNGWEPVFQFSKTRPKFNPQNVATPSDSVPVPSSEVGANTAGPNGKYWNLSDQVADGMAWPSNVIAASGVEAKTGHEAAFPVALPRWFIRAFSDPGDVVFDPFAGSGTTVIAAHVEGRVGFGMEISASYVDLVCRRFQELTGVVPVRDGVEHDFSS